jgi:hypothetical protein
VKQLASLLRVHNMWLYQAQRTVLTLEGGLATTLKRVLW